MKHSITFDPDKGKIYLECRYADRFRAKAVPGYEFSKKFKHWSYPAESIDLLVAAFPDLKTTCSLTIKTIREFLEKAEDRAKEIAEIKANPEAGRPVPAYLYEHQKVCLQLARKYGSFGFFLEPGTGKTVIGIECIREFGTPALVVCPLSIIDPAWAQDIEKFAPELKVVSLWGRTKSERISALLSGADVFIVNFEGLKVLKKQIKILPWRILIVDESSKMKSHKTGVTKNVLELGEKIPHRFCLTGTPAPNSPLEYFAQVKLVDPVLFGKSFYAFRNRYFFPSGYGGYQWQPNPFYLEDMMKKIANVSVVYSKEECLDLPEQIFETRIIPLTLEQERAYVQMSKEAVAMIQQNPVMATNILSKIMKLRQIISGFIHMEDGSRVKIKCNKYKELRDLLEEIGDHQVILWCQFHEEMDRVSNLLTTIGKTFTELSGRITNKDDKDKAVADFQSSAVQYIVAHPRSAGHGLTFTNCNYAVYVSLSYSLEEWEQTLARIHRAGQSDKCTYFVLLSTSPKIPKTIDAIQLRAIKAKQDINDELLKMLKDSQ